jgi:hypothetical protein
MIRGVTLGDDAYVNFQSVFAQHRFCAEKVFVTTLEKALVIVEVKKELFPFPCSGCRPHPPPVARIAHQAK